MEMLKRNSLQHMGQHLRLLHRHGNDSFLIPKLLLEAFELLSLRGVDEQHAIAIILWATERRE